MKSNRKTAEFLVEAIYNIIDEGSIEEAISAIEKRIDQIPIRLDRRTSYEIARDAIVDVIKEPDNSIEQRIHAVKALHEICEAMRGTQCTDFRPKEV